MKYYRPVDLELDDFDHRGCRPAKQRLYCKELIGLNAAETAISLQVDSMLENCKTAQERWGGTHEMIDRWLADRQTALISYFAIQNAQGEEELNKHLQIFCQQLVDYVSEGHFEIYEQLFREAKEFDDGGIDVARALYPQIEEYTQVILDFNDKYISADHVVMNKDSLKEDLSALGEKMTERFEVEDQLIEQLHTVHKKVIA